MIFPELQPSSRKREFDSYSDELRALTIQAWLFEGKTHREIDREILGLDSDISKGYQSMGVLHFIGLKANSRNIFSGINNTEALKHLESSPYDLSTLVPYVNFKTNNSNVDLKQLTKKEQKEVSKSRDDTPEKRKERLKKANTKPKRTRVYSYVYERNPDVIAEALERADGICEKCNNKAPFKRKSNDTHYLEVHHLIPLSEKGPDTIDNVKALCPNCHREFHYG